MNEFKLPKLEGNKPVGPDIIYFSCDPKYWHEYGFYLAKSTIHFNPDIFLHIHILYNNKIEPITKINGYKITYSYECVDDNFVNSLILTHDKGLLSQGYKILETINEKVIKRKIYFASARFIRMKELFKDKQHVLQLDADGLCRKNFSIDEFRETTKLPSAMRKPKDPDTLIASAITPGTGIESAKFKKELANKMTEIFTKPIYWFIDQTVLREVFRKIKFESIPYKWNAWGFKDFDIFSTAKGRKKNNWRYLDRKVNWLTINEQKEYIRNTSEERKQRFLRKKQKKLLWLKK